MQANLKESEFEDQVIDKITELTNIDTNGRDKIESILIEWSFFTQLSYELILFQRSLAAWREKNFPDSGAEEQFIGMVEELGEIAQAKLKLKQGIRGNAEDWKTKEKDAIGDLFIYMLNYCSCKKISIFECINLAWSEVKQRDWIKYPKNGVSE